MAEKFTCKTCREVTEKTDYHWKDENLYLSLKRIGLCEECARA